MPDNIHTQMKKILFLLLAAYFTACTNNPSVIEGTLPSDDYDGQVVFWVPMEGDHPKPVDSTHVQKNTFHLVISDRNLNKMGIVRVRPHLRLALQEILVFTEAGTVQLKLDSVSSSTGTPLNDVLQDWKDRKWTYDKEVFALRKELKAAGANNDTGIKEALESMSVDYYGDIYQIVLANKNNEIGKFIFLQYKSFFTPEQVQELGIEE